MSRLSILFFVCSPFFSPIYHSYGQGCSDAGICTMHSFKPSSIAAPTDLNNQFKVGVFGGKADKAIAVYGGYLEFNRQFHKKFGVDIKLTSIVQNGNGISSFGLSDVFLTTNYTLNNGLKLTLGSKIPLSNANKIKDNLPLPMDYQSSLGTFDLIFGIGYEIKNVQFAFALQQPLSQNNNQFLASDQPANSTLSTFLSTNKFERSSDVLIRVSYPIKLRSKLRLTPSLLPIYHLKNDAYTDEFNVKKEISGSQGLTFNANAYLDYEINNNNFLQFNLGAPFITRKTRPDGLTRHFVATIEYKVLF